MANKITDMNKIRKALKFHCNGKSKLFMGSVDETEKIAR
jgi:hypothetical protein